MTNYVESESETLITCKKILRAAKASNCSARNHIKNQNRTCDKDARDVRTSNWRKQERSKQEIKQERKEGRKKSRQDMQ
jgi:hypothetical protein